MKLGEQATKSREAIKYTAEKLEYEVDYTDEERQKKRAAKWHGVFRMLNGIDKETKAESRNIYKNETTTMLRKRKRNGAKVSLTEKINIIRSVIVDTQDY